MVALMGAFHGINPGMGWLFAVALGLQDKRRRSLFRALPPLALGHGVALFLCLMIYSMSQLLISQDVIRWLAGVTLVAFGIILLIRRQHPRWVGMRVGFWDLSLWSFIMAMAHGAGLMLIPVFLIGQNHATMHESHGEAAMFFNWWDYLSGVFLHTGVFLLVTTGIAWVVYRYVGVKFLRTSWFNLDLIWAIALIISGVLALVM
ncbi:hypothetical protein [Marininema halotolerans]|nr:hypothetical protein [Marininema halotolerans]